MTVEVDGGADGPNGVGSALVLRHNVAAMGSTTGAWSRYHLAIRLTGRWQLLCLAENGAHPPGQSCGVEAVAPSVSATTAKTTLEASSSTTPVATPHPARASISLCLGATTSAHPSSAHRAFSHGTCSISCWHLISPFARSERVDC